MKNEFKVAKIECEKQKWSKPILKTVSSDELKKIITVSACSILGNTCSSRNAR